MHGKRLGSLHKGLCSRSAYELLPDFLAKGRFYCCPIATDATTDHDHLSPPLSPDKAWDVFRGVHLFVNSQKIMEREGEGRALCRNHIQVVVLGMAVHVLAVYLAINHRW